jgi:hypothetical protein
MVACSFKKRFVDPIRVGLSRVSLSFDCPPKRQTIRAIGKRRHARPGETLQLYTAMRTKQCELIGEAPCSSVEPIVIKVPKDDAWLWIRIGEAKAFEAGDDFAIADGFQDIEDMWNFWRSEHPDTAMFSGVLIKWVAP